LNVLDMEVGTRVRSLRDFVSVPKGTEGLIDEIYPDGEGCMIAWDLPDRPLPEGYERYDGRPQVAPGTPLRDGFSVPELTYLEVVETGSVRDGWKSPLSLERRG
jgi:hypothetical protein